MKKLLLEDVHDEQPVRVSKSAMPKLSYKQTTQSWFLLSHQVHQVSSCSSHHFQDFVDQVSASVKKPLCGALKRLQFADPIDRWYVLNELLIHGAIVKLYTTKEQANNAILAENERKG